MQVSASIRLLMQPFWPLLRRTSAELTIGLYACCWCLSTLLSVTAPLIRLAVAGWLVACDMHLSLTTQMSRYHEM